MVIFTKQNNKNVYDIHKLPRHLITFRMPPRRRVPNVAHR